MSSVALPPVDATGQVETFDGVEATYVSVPSFDTYGRVTEHLAGVSWIGRAGDDTAILAFTEDSAGWSLGAGVVVRSDGSEARVSRDDDGRIELQEVRDPAPAP